MFGASGEAESGRGDFFCEIFERRAEFVLTRGRRGGKILSVLERIRDWISIQIHAQVLSGGMIDFV